MEDGKWQKENVSYFEGISNICYLWHSYSFGIDKICFKLRYGKSLLYLFNSEGQMNSISKPPERKIIEDFAKEITERSITADPPAEEVIYFRNWHIIRKKSPVKLVPVEILRYRKDNGRIASDVLSYDKLNGSLIEKDENAQRTLKKFLDEKDSEKTSELMNSIRHSSQRVPAVITSDGFLINGNRRKLALEKLYEDTKDEKFKWMRVVIL